MEKQKTKFLMLFLGGLTFIVVLSFFALGISKKERKYIQKNVAFASEGENENETQEVESVDENIYAPKVETFSEQISPNVKEETIKTTFFDRDRDGIFDNEDEYPTINNFFIVKDDNGNGIVDKYEQ